MKEKLDLIELQLEGNGITNKTKPGDLVEIIPAMDQSLYERSFCGKLGILVENVSAHRSPNIWKIFVEDQCVYMHNLDFKVVQPAKEKKQ